jgi:hypothetical protein
MARERDERGIEGRNNDQRRGTGCEFLLQTRQRIVPKKSLSNCLSSFISDIILK